MELRTVERPEVLRSPSGESAPFPPEEAISIQAKFNQIINYGLISLIETPALRPNIPSVADIGRRALVKWQSRDPEKSWRPRSPWLRRVTTALGSTAVITVATELFPRGAQAYTMVRHGMHFGFEHIPGPTVDGILPSDTNHAVALAEAPNSAPDMVFASQQADNTPIHDVHYNSGAKTISYREGWFNQFRQMGIHGSNAQLDNLLDDVGGKLHDRGLAYYDHNANEWRMNLVDPNNSGSGYHHAHGNGSLREQDLDYIMNKAADHNLVEHHFPDVDNNENTSPDTNSGSAEHKHPPTQPPPPSTAPEPHNNPDLGQPSVEVKEVNWVEASENWIETQWNDMINTWSHFIELDFKEAGNELVDAWNGFWHNWNWLKAAVLGGALFAMRKYEQGRQAYEAAYPGATLLRTRFREVSWRSPRTWRNVDWRAWRRRPVVAQEESASTTVPVSHITHPAGPLHRQ